MHRINFRKERDLGQTLDVASTFIKQHFFKILKPTLIVVIIPLLLGSVIMSMGFKDIYGGAEYLSNPAVLFSYMRNMFLSYGLTLIAYTLGFVMILGYIKLYVDGKEDISLSDLLPILKSKALMLVLSSILIFIVIYIGTILCVLPGIYFAVVLAHFFAVAVIEDRGFGESWQRCFSIIKDNWWSTFGLYIVTYLICIGVMILAYIPIYAIMGMQMFKAVSENDPNSVLDSMSNMAYILPLYHVIGLIVSIIYAVISTIRYYSLVEKKEGTGEKELINQL